MDGQIAEWLAHQFCAIDERGRDHDTRTPLIVVKYGDGNSVLEFSFNLKRVW